MGIERVFIPWGEFRPDQKLFGGGASEGRLLGCRQVVPVYGNYAVAPTWPQGSTTWPGPGNSTESLGLHAHTASATTYYAYLGDTTKLWELAPSSFARTDRSRAIGGAYSPGTNGWNGTSFGSSVIMTNGNDDPQLLTIGAPNFIKLATSIFDPKFKFVCSLKNNVIGANCALAAPYDTLSAGANLNLVVWSQNDNPQAFGSQNLNPELTGADYQPLLNDFGEITGLVGGEYALVAQQRAWVRIEGPAGSAFSFRVIVAGTGCRFPLSIGYYDGDVYFWGPSGPSRLPGGEGPIQVLGNGKIVRTLLDNTTGFSGDAVIASIDPRHVAFMSDPDNQCVGWIFTNTAGASSAIDGNVTLVYNVPEDRFSFFDNLNANALPGGLLFPCRHQPLTSGWLPFRDTIAVQRSGTGTDSIGVATYGSQSGTPTFATGFIQIAPDRVSRILRVRPVASVSSPSGSGLRDLAMTAWVRSKNRVWDNAVESGPYDNLTQGDRHGWITVPGTKAADFQQVEVGITSGARNISTCAEMKGVELEVLVGGSYSE